MSDEDELDAVAGGGGLKYFFSSQMFFRTGSNCLQHRQPLMSHFLLEQTRLGGIDYILVTDCEEGDGEAMILKDISEDGLMPPVALPKFPKQPRQIYS